MGFNQQYSTNKMEQTDLQMNCSQHYHPDQSGETIQCIDALQQTLEKYTTVNSQTSLVSKLHNADASEHHALLSLVSWDSQALRHN